MAHSPMADLNGCSRSHSRHGRWPFEALHAMQQATKLLGTVKPPHAFGTTWSIVGRPASSALQ
jgi:hypothetical protein